jgi:hypothetical protein
LQLFLCSIEVMRVLISVCNNRVMWRLIHLLWKHETGKIFREFHGRGLIIVEMNIVRLVWNSIRITRASRALVKNLIRLFSIFTTFGFCRKTYENKLNR